MRVLDNDGIAAEARRLYRKTCRVDLMLGQCYSASFSIAIIFVLLPSQLSRIGAFIMLVALAYMIAKIRAAHAACRQPPPSSPRLLLAADLIRLRARCAIAQSAFFNLPFLVGANLVFMGLPLHQNPVREATLHCLFLALTVALFSASFLLNQALLRRKPLSPLLHLSTPSTPG